jgi:hypothetical protein
MANTSLIDKNSYQIELALSIQTSKGLKNNASLKNNRDDRIGVKSIRLVFRSDFERSSNEFFHHIFIFPSYACNEAMLLIYQRVKTACDANRKSSK